MLMRCRRSLTLVYVNYPVVKLISLYSVLTVAKPIASKQDYYVLPLGDPRIFLGGKRSPFKSLFPDLGASFRGCSHAVAVSLGLRLLDHAPTSSFLPKGNANAAHKPVLCLIKHHFPHLGPDFCAHSQKGSLLKYTLFLSEKLCWLVFLPAPSIFCKPAPLRLPLLDIIICSLECYL